MGILSTTRVKTHEDSQTLQAWSELLKSKWLEMPSLKKFLKKKQKQKQNTKTKRKQNKKLFIEWW